MAHTCCANTRMFGAMEPQVEALFTEKIKQQAAQLADAHTDGLKPLGSFENYVFEFAHSQGPRILRLTHSSHRILEQVVAEVDYVNYLAANGVRVAAPIENVNGNMAEAIEATDGSYFIAAIFHKASGVGKEGFEFEPEILEDWGRITGQMHHLAQSYTPATGIATRYHWQDDPLLLNGSADERLDARARERFQELHAAMKTLPERKDAFGLIHTDLHHGNFFVHQQRIIAFDFDDCCYQHFVHDIAIPLYYALWKGYKGMDYQSFTVHFLKHFAKGYQQANLLPKDWLVQLPLFLDMRSFVIYAVLTQKLDPANVTQKHMDTLEYCRKLAVGEMPLLNFDIAEVLADVI